MFCASFRAALDASAILAPVPAAFPICLKRFNGIIGNIPKVTALATSMYVPKGEYSKICGFKDSIPVYYSLERASRAIGKFTRYYEFHRNKSVN